MRHDLVGALLSWVDPPLRGITYKFLCGLALDELRFLAGFCGACVLESSAGIVGFREHIAHRMAGYPNCCRRSDQDLNMILLVEYLNRGGLHPAPQPAPLPRGQAPASRLSY